MAVPKLDRRDRKRLVQLACIAAWSDAAVAKEEGDFILDLCRRLGIEGELIETDRRFRRAFVVRRGRLVPVPEGFTLMSPARIWPIITTPLFSLLGKLRLAWEYFVTAKKDDADESLARPTITDRRLRTKGRGPDGTRFVIAAGVGTEVPLDAGLEGHRQLTSG